ncbi:MAG: hypothetical protein OXE99_12700 [Cellvibrionales bacterium]|nr:hypothetical protein [Cellvibrionales bacterium]
MKVGYFTGFLTAFLMYSVSLLAYDPEWFGYTSDPKMPGESWSCTYNAFQIVLSGLFHRLNKQSQVPSLSQLVNDHHLGSQNTWLEPGDIASFIESHSKLCPINFQLIYLDMTMKSSLTEKISRINPHTKLVREYNRYPMQQLKAILMDHFNQPNALPVIIDDTAYTYAIVDSAPEAQFHLYDPHDGLNNFKGKKVWLSLNEMQENRKRNSIKGIFLLLLPVLNQN